MTNVKLNAEALMAGGKKVLDGVERRRLDDVDHDRRCQDRNASGADKRCRMLWSDQEMCGSGETGGDAGKIDHACRDDCPTACLTNPAANVQLAARSAARSNMPR
jgi:hypothetical protein